MEVPGGSVLTPKTVCFLFPFYLFSRIFICAERPFDGRTFSACRVGVVGPRPRGWKKKKRMHAIAVRSSVAVAAALAVRALGGAAGVVTC